MKFSRGRCQASIPAFLVLSALLLGSGPAWSASAAYHRPFQWLPPDGGEPLHGLYLFDLAPGGMVNRVLAETPGKRPVIITETFNPQRGIKAAELVDVISGWKATFEVDLGLSRPSVQALFDAWKQIGSRHTYKARLALDHGPSVEIELQLDEPPVMLHEAFRRRLVAEDRIGELAATIPDGLKQSLLFLDTSLSPTPVPSGEVRDDFAYTLRGIVEILAGAVRYADPDHENMYEVRWPMDVAKHTRGLVIGDPELLEFVAQFHGLDLREPLADRRATNLWETGGGDSENP